MTASAPETVDRLEGWIAHPHLSISELPRDYGLIRAEVDLKRTGSINGRVSANG
jgi:hypothetical protein